jgi:hypothetical protein
LLILSPKDLKIFYIFNKGRSKVKAIVGGITANILLITFRPKRDNTNPLGTEIVRTKYRGRRTINVKIKG